MTMERMPKRSARASRMPPKEAVNQRIGEVPAPSVEPRQFLGDRAGPTTVIAGATENEIEVIANAVTQMTQDLRLSTVGTGVVEAIVEQTLVLAN